MLVATKSKWKILVSESQNMFTYEWNEWILFFWVSVFASLFGKLDSA